MKSIVWTTALCAVAAAGCSSSARPLGFDEPVASTHQGLSVTAITTYPQVAIANDDSLAREATGAVFVPILLDSGAVATTPTSSYGTLQQRGTCGVTFVSPHYAITSSHCFDDANVPNPNQTFGVWQYDVTTANVDSFYLDALMEGTYPNYAPVFGQIVNQVPGYSATGYTCSIASRCQNDSGDEFASNINCTGVNAPDITMLYCPERASAASWVNIANDPATTQEVPLFMYWFHELFTPNGSEDMTEHYTENPIFADNWHYLGAPSNILVPLKSIPFPFALRQRWGDGGDSDVLTDLYGCHGTSGSGVLEQNGETGELELLGPVHAAGLAWGNEFLCDDPQLLVSGGVECPGGPACGHGLTYNSNTSVNTLVNAMYYDTLVNDRRVILRR